MNRSAASTPAGVVMRCLASVAAVAVATYLVWALRSLILPMVVGGLLAYICRPVVTHLERFRIPRGVAVGLLLLVFALIALVIVTSIRAVVPTEVDALELRVRALNALHHRYQALMGLDPSWSRGNRLYRVVHRQLDPLVDRAGELLALTADERAQLVASHTAGTHGASAGSKRLLEYERANAEVLEMRARPTARSDRTATSPEPPSASPPVAKNAPAAPEDTFATWVIAPLIFLFLLSDTGSIKRGLLSIVPNRLFEPALAVLADLDEALGSYVRGIALECCCLGVTVLVFITIVGVPFRWAIPIGIFTGASNVVPYMGFAAALLSGLGYALLAEEIHPLLPFVTADTFAIWVVVAVALAELVKNVIYEPIVLGGAVKLHPLAVVMGLAGGAVLFGPVGLFLAIPTITVVKVLVTSSARHLKAYGLI